MHDECTCGQRFRTAEDYRDHLPCGGDPKVNAAKTHRTDDIAKWLLARTPVEWQDRDTLVAKMRDEFR